MNTSPTRSPTRPARRWPELTCRRARSPQDLQALRSFVQAHFASDPGLQLADGIGRGVFAGRRLRRHHRHQSLRAGSQRFPRKSAPSHSRLRLFRNLSGRGWCANSARSSAPRASMKSPCRWPSATSRWGMCGWASPRCCCAARSRAEPARRAATVAGGHCFRHAFGGRGLLPRAAARSKTSRRASTCWRAASFPGPCTLKRRDEWGILSSKLHLLGEQMRGEKAAFVRLQENLDQIFINLSDGLLLFDQQDRLVLATPAAARFLGPSIRTTAQRPALEVFSQDTPLHQTAAPSLPNPPVAALEDPRIARRARHPPRRQRAVCGRRRSARGMPHHPARHGFARGNSATRSIPPPSSPPSGG